MSTCIGGKWDPYFIIYIIINSKWITRHNRGATERQERQSQEKIDLYMPRRDREEKRERSIDW